MTGQNLETIIKIVLWYEHSFCIDSDLKSYSMEREMCSVGCLYINISTVTLPGKDP